MFSAIDRHAETIGWLNRAGRGRRSDRLCGRQRSDVGAPILALAPSSRPCRRCCVFRAWTLSPCLTGVYPANDRAFRAIVPPAGKTVRPESSHGVERDPIAIGNWPKPRHFPALRGLLSETEAAFGMVLDSGRKRRSSHQIISEPFLHGSRPAAELLWNLAPRNSY